MEFLEVYKHFYPYIVLNRQNIALGNYTINQYVLSINLLCQFIWLVGLSINKVLSIHMVSSINMVLALHITMTINLILSDIACSLSTR